jgi:hypothetical protein
MDRLTSGEGESELHVFWDNDLFSGFLLPQPGKGGVYHSQQTAEICLIKTEKKGVGWMQGSKKKKT